ncbi:hypothetical protein RCL_jg26319.t1 [Rhizophagus clarus]|uniref:Uncharacterized protein n=1 Tax=Rhizophagus clarus TaxID=94130 RepID=A0A8H3QGW1_9GLOM|nr:hypothetical protein RCL_jg26319.t1 [Rhizophagus clarus]
MFIFTIILNLNSLGEQAELTFKLIAWFKPSKDISDTLRLGLRKPYATQNRKEPLTLVKSDLSRRFSNKSINRDGFLI